MASEQPDRWGTAALGDVADLLTGQPFKSERYTDDQRDPRLLGGDNIAQGHLRWDNVRRWPRSDVGGLDRYWLEEGDVVLAMDRPWIEAGLKRASVGKNDLPALLVQRTARLRGSPSLDVGYLRYIISSRGFVDYVLGVQTGSVVPHISPSQIKAFQFVLPPIDEQRRIAAVLGALDDKIELNRKMNRTLENMAQAIFKSWFIDFDGHEPEDFVDSELGPIPKGWRVSQLGSLCWKIGSGATPRGGKDAYVEAGTSFIRSQNVYDFDFDWGGLVRLMDQDAERLQGVTVEQDDLLLNITGDSILRTCVVDPAVLPARVNQHVAIIRPKPPLASSILHLHLVHPRTKSWLLGHSAGATRKAVTKGHLERVPVPLPPDQDLIRYGSVLAPLYAKRAANWAESRTLAALRDALLPKLISGEIRVPEAEAAVGDAG